MYDGIGYMKTAHKYTWSWKDFRKYYICWLKRETVVKRGRQLPWDDKCQGQKRWLPRKGKAKLNFIRSRDNSRATCEAVFTHTT